jgi:hypothetical protein
MVTSHGASDGHGCAGTALVTAALAVETDRWLATLEFLAFAVAANAQPRARAARHAGNRDPRYLGDLDARLC